jgi:organic radical activating enzyme
MNASPDRHDHLTFEQIRSVIDSLCEFSKPRMVVFSGGEPLLLGDDLLNAIAYVDGLGIRTRVVTNCYWAVSSKIAKEKLVELRESGLQQLVISTDDEHQHYVIFEQVKYAWQASKGLGFQSVAIANSSLPDSRITPDFIMEHLGEEIRLLYDKNRRHQTLKKSEDGTIYFLSNSNVQHLGRAKEYIDRDKVRYVTKRFEGGCQNVLRDPALSPTGHLVGCCGMEVESNSVLYMGDTSIDTAANIIVRADENIMLNAIALLGPLFLKHFIEHHAPEVSFYERYATFCQLCEHIVNRPTTVKVLLDNIAELSGIVLDKRRRLG